MLRTVRVEKLDEKIGVICRVSMIVMISAGNLSLSKQFTCMHLKVVIKVFQKIWFIGV